MVLICYSQLCLMFAFLFVCYYQLFFVLIFLFEIALDYLFLELKVFLHSVLPKPQLAGLHWCPHTSPRVSMCRAFWGFSRDWRPYQYDFSVQE